MQAHLDGSDDKNAGAFGQTFFDRDSTCESCHLHHELQDFRSPLQRLFFFEIDLLLRTDLTKQ